MQSWTLQRKIQVTQTRIIEWYLKHEGKVYVSFSGGKDSTVLLDLARKCCPDIEAVFIDTGLEYPEIRSFVKTKENVTWLSPLKYDHCSRKYIPTNFKEVIKLYGYPLISKEVSQSIWEARRPTYLRAQQKFDDSSEYVRKYGKRYSLSRWNFLKDSDIPISHLCCKTMKKDPAKQYEKASGNKCIVATMASESTLRKTEWLRSGCNSFEGRPMSKPMSFWTEQDVLKYLKLTQLPYCSVYGDIVEEYTNYKKKENMPTGKLILTGVQRTGCMFCMFGCHLEKEPNHFQQMKITHPKQYDYCIRDVEDNGLGLGKILDYIGVKY